MKHESVSEARHELAMRITKRAARMVETRVILPFGEPDPERLAESERLRAQADDRQAAINAAKNGMALRRMGNNGSYYKPAPSLSRERISGKAVRDLVEEGQLEWLKAPRTGAERAARMVRAVAVLKERGRGA